MIETPHFYPYLNLERNLRIICDIKGMAYGDIGRNEIRYAAVGTALAMIRQSIEQGGGLLA